MRDRISSLPFAACVISGRIDNNEVISFHVGSVVCSSPSSFCLSSPLVDRMRRMASMYTISRMVLDCTNLFAL